jgi:hypothetical protein
MADPALDNKLDQIIYLLIRLNQAQNKVDAGLHLSAKSLINQIRQHGIYDDIRDAEFKVYSQFGDDGIIQYLIHAIDIPPSRRTFVEFGVENYVESNTRFLLYNDNWSGLVMDGSRENVQFIQQDVLRWRHELNAVCAFIDRDNINSLISENGYRDEIGILSIDVDGNDYWIWDAITAVNPIIVVTEYNSTLGWKKALTIPYDPRFVRHKAHYSGLYFGCSIAAFCMLAEKKGYAFVGSNSQGNNAYFVRKDKVGRLPVLSAEQGYVQSKFRESVDPTGRLTYLSFTERKTVIGDMPVIDLSTGANVTVRQALAANVTT